MPPNEALLRELDERLMEMERQIVSKNEVSTLNILELIIIIKSLMSIVGYTVVWQETRSKE